MEILTIVQTLPKEFDAQVNAAMAAGWHLTKRERVDLTGCKEAYFLYAELVKVDEPAAPMTWQEAAQVLKSTCSETDTCDTCKLREWCDQYLYTNAAIEPQDWEVPTE